jgi:hypothetical protein
VALSGVHSSFMCETEPNTGTSSFTYEAKLSTGIIGASAGKSLSVQVMNGTFHPNAKIHIMPLFTFKLLNSKNSLF